MPPDEDYIEMLGKGARKTVAVVVAVAVSPRSRFGLT